MRITPQLSSNSVKYIYFSGNSLAIMWNTEGQTYIHFFQNLKYLIYWDTACVHSNNGSYVIYQREVRLLVLAIITLFIFHGRTSNV